MRRLDLGDVAAASALEFAQQVCVLVIEPLGHHHLDVHVQVATRAGTQMRHTVAAAGGHRIGLRPRGNRDLGQSVDDRVDGHGRAQRRVDHRHRDRAVQVVTVSHEDVVRLFVDLDVEVAGGSTAGTHFSLGGQPNPHAVADAGGIFTAISRRACTRPSPPHWWHGSGMTSPTPRQVGHGRAVITWPRRERCTVCTSPRPPQVSHDTG